jgi:hypothetical protein
MLLRRLPRPTGRVTGVSVVKPVCLALGFNGESIAGRGATPVVLISPVTFRRIWGRPDVGADDTPVVRVAPPVSLNLSWSVSSVNGELSAPRACRRAFSCLACTVLK